MDMKGTPHPLDGTPSSRGVVEIFLVTLSVVDLGEGPQGPGLHLLFSVKKRRNHRRKKTEQGKQNTPPSLRFGLATVNVTEKSTQHCSLHVCYLSRFRR